MNIPKGDFIGFTIDGIHSSTLGIIRVSDGSRFTENLLPNFSDKTVQVPGGDGMYYFGREYSSRPFTINIAYDNLKESQLRRLKQLLHTKTTHSLIFDEWPYKIYEVVTQSPPQLKFLCFDSEMGERVYKGEGTLNFISHTPYAITKYKYLEDYSGNINDTLPEIVQSWYGTESNLDEWISSSGISSKTVMITDSSTTFETNLDTYHINMMGQRCIYVYNPGDVDTPFQMAIPIGQTPMRIGITFTANEITNKLQFTINEEDVATGDNGIVIDTEIGAILGHTSSNPAIMLQNPERSNLYNKCITKGDFFNIPPVPVTKMGFDYTPYTATDAIKIQYNYRYL